MGRAELMTKTRVTRAVELGGLIVVAVLFLVLALLLGRAVMIAGE